MTYACLSLALLSAPWPLSFVGVMIAAEREFVRQQEESPFDERVQDAEFSGEFSLNEITGVFTPGRNFRVQGWRVRKPGKLSEYKRWVRERVKEIREKGMG